MSKATLLCHSVSVHVYLGSASLNSLRVFLRALRAFAVIPFFLVITACEGKSAAPPVATDSPRADVNPDLVQPKVHGKLSYLALGDSYTIGEHIDASGRWPMQLAAKMRSSGTDISDPIILARTSWTTNDLQSALDDANFQGPYDLVTLLIGVNDQYRGYALDSTGDHFDVLLKRSIALAGKNASHVVVLSIPDWGLTPFGKQSGRSNVTDEIKQFNAAEKELTEKSGAAWVDIGEPSNLVATDGLHPSAKLYEQWAEMAVPTVKRALANWE
jgi:lysophospholipase L1-like esterase